MLFDQQEMYYGLDLDYCAGERDFYLSPMEISEDRHTFVIGNNSDDLKGLQGPEREAKCKRLKMDMESRYSFYIAQAMLRFQDRNSIIEIGRAHV